MDTIEMLDDTLDELKRARETMEAAREVQKRIMETAQNSPDYQRAQAAREAAESAAADCEKEIKRVALDLAELCAPLPERVKVKMFAIVTPYDKVAAREWCFANFRPALALDEKTFEKAVKDGYPRRTCDNNQRSQSADCNKVIVQ